MFNAFSTIPYIIIFQILWALEWSNKKYIYDGSSCRNDSSIFESSFNGTICIFAFLGIKEMDKYG